MIYVYPNGVDWLDGVSLSVRSTFNITLVILFYLNIVPMKRFQTRLVLGVLFALSLLCFTACNGGSGKDSGAVNLEITVSGASADQPAKTLYLYRVILEEYDYIEPYDSILCEGEYVRRSYDTLRAQRMILSALPPSAGGPAIMGAGLHLFVAPGRYPITFFPSVEGSPCELALEEAPEPHRAWVRYDSGFRGVMMNARHEQLFAEFYAAREINDTSRMAEINSELSEIAEQVEKDYDPWYAQQVEAAGKGSLGLYIFFTREFEQSTFNTLAELEEQRSRLASYDAAAQVSDYARRITTALDRMSASVEGAQAPNITGNDLNGNPLSLSDLRGKWVLVDFWASGCSWCRLETPYLKKAKLMHDSSKLVILGVSTDFEEQSWRKAIQEDSADWTHIILDRQARLKTSDDYYIQGIPLILLVDPEGNIVRRNLRGDEILRALDKALL